MMNGLKTIAFSALATIVVTVSPVAAEPGKKGFTMDFSAIGAVMPYVAFGGAGAGDAGRTGLAGDTPDAALGEVDPGGRMAVGARIALSGAADMTLGYSLMMAPSGAGGQGQLTPAHRLILGFNFKF